MTEENEEQKDQGRIENARVGYQAAMNLWIYEGEIFWSKFNALLVANSIVLGSIALSMSDTCPLSIFTIGMPVTGIILCLVWFLTTKRSFDYYRYWIFSAREIEEQYLSNSVQTISRGGKFADGKVVEIVIGGEGKRLKMSRWGRFRVEWSSYLIISLFFMIYALLLVINVISLVTIIVN